MTRRDLLRMIVSLGVVGPLVACGAGTIASEPKRLPLVGYLASSGESAQTEPFSLGLRDLGYVEGQNIRVEYRYPPLDQLSSAAAELVALKVDVLVAHGDGYTVALKRATTTIPIVFATAADPIGNGLVASLARPGGNVTGLSDPQAVRSVKYLELLGPIVPDFADVGVISTPDSQGPDRRGGCC